MGVVSHCIPLIPRVGVGVTQGRVSLQVILELCLPRI